MKYFVIIFVIALFGISGSLGGIFDSFSTNTDYNIAFAMDTIFGVALNTTKYVVNGNNTNPIDVDVTILCGSR